MGCSSSALHQAGDSGRLRSGAPSNDNFSAAEQSESCVTQPKPCTPGGESTFYGNTQREKHPLERPKASVVPTANGVKSHHQASLVKDGIPKMDATDQPGPTKKAEPLEQQEESESPQPGGKDDTPEPEGAKGDVERGPEAQPLKGSAEPDRLGTEAEGQPPRTAGGRDAPGAVGSLEKPQAPGVMKPLGTDENILPLETALKLPPGDATGKEEQPQIPEANPKENTSPETSEGCHCLEKVEQQELQELLEKGEQSQLLETIPKEKNSPGISEESQSAETSEEKQVPETPGKDEQSQLLETVLKENATPEISDRSQLVQTPVTNDLLRETPEGPRIVADSQPEETVGNREHLAATTGAAASVRTARKPHTDEEPHIEGEKGEKMVAEMENEKECEGAETKEEETGEAVDLSAAGDGDRRASAHSMLQ